MNNRDRETWERFAAALVCCNYSTPATRDMLMGKWLVEQADRFLALTKERWPEKTVTAGCETVTPEAAGDETVTEPDPGEGYRWLKVGETIEERDQWLDHATRCWELTNTPGWVCKTTRHYRRRIDAAPETTPRADEVRSEVRSTGGGGVEEPPEPVMYSIVWDGDDTPDPECCFRTSALAHRCLADAGGKGTVVPLYAVPVDAAREIAAARREAEEARKECERLRMTATLHHAEPWAIQRAIDRLHGVMDVLSGARERDDNAVRVLGGLLRRLGGAA